MARKYTLEEARALLTAEITAEISKKAKKASKPKKAAKAKPYTDKKGREWESFVDLKKAHGEARMARWEKSERGGLTSKQRKEIAATLPYGYTEKQWAKAVAKFKKGGFR